MGSSFQTQQLSIESLATDIFLRSAGQWKSTRRYYTLKQETSQEVVSFLEIEFIESGHPILIDLAKRHGLKDDVIFVCGSQVSWDSHYCGPEGKQVKGSTIFGVLGDILYRDRGFATSKPVTAQLSSPNPQSLCLKTEYGGSAFEEEIKLVGQQYRTRQTIISRAGEEHTIGQYLEKRI
ncbi:phycobiliprotein lyase [Oscillatoriales cyanobacterium LEGE 11467]|uniref:Chromophore lyase CpcS/CpeS n=1 Tax=Zarconia navalis LEGE 11467 TaxID=1828826 RepID=A0A928Z8H0_9CYAN|nr:phycobiliprotein lyase [Zarconia navalis]MBE9040658.1 phycobiliprotein lyase [Zarconia navalis LEGE 11467]